MFQLLDCSPLPQFAVTPDNKVTYWNKACEALTGFDAAEMIGTDRHWEPFYTHKRPLVADLILRKDLKQFFSLYEGKNPGQSELVPNAWEAYDLFTNLGGRVRRLHFIAAPVHDERGKLIGAVETLQDLSAPPDPKLAALLSQQVAQLEKDGYLTGHDGLGDIIGKSKAMQETYGLIAKAARASTNVIIHGESGTGKELAARTIHNMSDRRHQNFVTVNCGAIPETLIESEFFGYRKGAFTGAATDRPGFLDRADGGTLFLDEIGEITVGMQVKLLRVIEGNGFSPLGSHETKTPDVRIIGATNQNLEKLVRSGKMRKDFFYRIHVIPVHLPPLRQRDEDLHLLVDHFVSKFSEGKKVPEIPYSVRQALASYHWPGNVRELQNVLHRYLTLNRLDFLSSESPQPKLPALPSLDIPADTTILQTALGSFEKEFIMKVLHKTRWHKGNAAALLGVSRKTLFRKMRSHGLL